MENGNKKKIAIVGSVGVPAKYGGFETLAHQLVLQFEDKVPVIVYCTSKKYPQKTKEFHGAKLKYLPLKANGPQSILYDALCILHASLSCKNILILGVSGAIVLPFMRLIFWNRKYCVHMDGLEWRRGKWKSYAKIFLKISEKIAVRFSNKLIVDNQGIKDYFKENYKKKTNLITYGGDHVVSELEGYEFKNKNIDLNSAYAFKVCRIVPENNLKMVMDAFVAYNKLPLLIVGDWDSSDYGRSLKAKYAKQANIQLISPIYDQEELDALRLKSKFYVHGHSAGGTNPSLVEAMALGKPIVAYDVSFNRLTTYNKGLYFKSTEELIDLLKNLNDDQLKENGQNMKSIASKKYTWKKIASQFEELFID